MDLKLLNQARSSSRLRNWVPQTFARVALLTLLFWLPVLGIAAPLVLDELLELEELLVVGVAEGVAELLELEELPVVGVALGVVALLLVVGVAVGVVALLELEELPVVGVALGVAALLLELEELPVLELELEEPPVTGTPLPATLFMKLPLALTPIPSSFWRRPRSSCNQSPNVRPLICALDWLLPLFELLLLELFEPLLFDWLFVAAVPPFLMSVSACVKAKAYWLRYC